MKIQVRSLAIALAIGGSLTVAATAQSSAAPINGMSIKAAVPALTTDVRYWANRDYPYASSTHPLQSIIPLRRLHGRNWPHFKCGSPACGEYLSAASDSWCLAGYRLSAKLSR